MCITEAYGQHSASNGFLIISLVVILTKKINKSEFTLKITKAGCKTYSRSEKDVKFTNNFSTHYLTPQGAMILCHIVGLKMQSLCTSRKKESKKDKKNRLAAPHHRCRYKQEAFSSADVHCWHRLTSCRRASASAAPWWRRRCNSLEKGNRKISWEPSGWKNNTFLWVKVWRSKEWPLLSAFCLLID